MSGRECIRIGKVDQPEGSLVQESDSNIIGCPYRQPEAVENGRGVERIACTCGERTTDPKQQTLSRHPDTYAALRFAGVSGNIDLWVSVSLLEESSDEQQRPLILLSEEKRRTHASAVAHGHLKATDEQVTMVNEKLFLEDIICNILLNCEYFVRRTMTNCLNNCLTSCSFSMHTGCTMQQYFVSSHLLFSHMV